MITVLVCLPSRDTYRLTRVSLTLDVGVSLHRCSSKAQPLLLTLDERYLLRAAPPDRERGLAPLGSAVQCSRSSLAVGLPLWAAAPDLGRGVAPLGSGP